MDLDNPLESFDAIFLGGGFQAELLLELMDWTGIPAGRVAIFDDTGAESRMGSRGARILGGLASGMKLALDSRIPTYVALGDKCAALRHLLRTRLAQGGVRLPNVIHPQAAIAPSARLADGLAIFAGCVIGPRAVIGAGACLFCGTIVEHDVRLGENVRVGPGAVMSGFVTIGAHAFIGAGAVITREAGVGERALVGAGATVVANIPDGVLALGTPARIRGPVRPGCEAPLIEEFAAIERGPLAEVLRRGGEGTP